MIALPVPIEEGWWAGTVCGQLSPLHAPTNIHTPSKPYISSPRAQAAVAALPGLRGVQKRTDPIIEHPPPRTHAASLLD
jgi:hypothetical protein